MLVMEECEGQGDETVTRRGMAIRVYKSKIKLRFQEPSVLSGVER